MIPVVVMFVFLFITWGDIAECLVIYFGYYELADNEKDDPTPNNATVLDAALGKDHMLFVKIDSFVLYWYTSVQYFLAIMPFCLYMLIIDLEDQYNISPELASWVPVISIFFINLLVVVAPNLFMFFSTIPSKFMLRSQLKEVDPSTILATHYKSGHKRIYADNEAVHPWPT